MQMTHRKAVLLMVVVTLMWSIAGVVTRHLEQARSFEVTFWRSFFTVVSLVAMLGLFHGRSAWARFRSSGWPLWASGLCWTVMFTAYMVS
ncbi:MAG: EamA family transporter, partial [Rhizobacter sp.]